MHGTLIRKTPFRRPIVDGRIDVKLHSKIIAFHEEGFTLQETGSKFGICGASVRAILKLYKLPRHMRGHKRRKLDIHQMALAKTLYLDGKSFKELATKFNASQKTIREALIGKGVEFNKYHGKVCVKCGHTERYNSSRNCVHCLAKRTAKKYDADGRYAHRLNDAKKRGIAAPPHENECAPYPTDELCQLCGGFHLSGRRLHLEHDHATGRFRGWACGRCNVMLGQVERVGLSKIAVWLGVSIPLK